MKARMRDTGEEGTTGSFNTAACSPVEVMFAGKDWYDTVFARDVDVWVNDQWKPLLDAFKDRDVIPDNYNQRFAVPQSEEARKRGWND